MAGQLPAAGDSALIVGAGRCGDLPLPSLFATFKTLKLLDWQEVDESLITGHDDGICETLVLLQEDVTGLAAELLPQLPSPKVRLRARLEELALALMKANPRWKAAPTLSEPVEFVASTLILSQLGRSLQTCIHQAVPKAQLDAILAGPSDAHRDYAEIIDHQYRKFLANRQREHIALLRRHVKDDGRVFLSCTPRLILKHGESTVSETELIADSLLQESLAEHFQILRHDFDPGWVSSFQYQGETMNRLFPVEIFDLRPRCKG